MSLIGKKLFIAVAPCTILNVEVVEELTPLTVKVRNIGGKVSCEGMAYLKEFQNNLNVYVPNVYSDYKLAREYLLEDLDNKVQSKQEELDELFNLITDVSAL